MFELISTAIVTILLVAAFQYLYQRNAYPNGIPADQRVIEETIQSIYGEDGISIYSCGNNTEEALSLGCVFDMSAIGWLPPQCQDKMLLDRYNTYGFRYYEDEARTTEVSLDRFASTATVIEPREMFWPTPGFHENHCSLTWERLHRAAQAGKRTLKHVLQFEHTRHCGELLESEHKHVSLPIAPLLHFC